MGQSGIPVPCVRLGCFLHTGKLQGRLRVHMTPVLHTDYFPDRLRVRLGPVLYTGAHFRLQGR